LVEVDEKVTGSEVYPGRREGQGSQGDEGPEVLRMLRCALGQVEGKAV
jgi:hypothetical protein